MKQTEKEFAALVKEQKSTIYSICYMFSKDKDESMSLERDHQSHPCLWRTYSRYYISCSSAP